MKALGLETFADQLSTYLSVSDVMAAKVLAEISTSIVKKRLQMKMTQKEFAAFVGVSQGMISKWESENYNFSIEALAEICEKLNLELQVEMKDATSPYQGILHQRTNRFNVLPKWENEKVLNKNICGIAAIA